MKRFLSTILLITVLLSVLVLSSCEVFTKERVLSIGVAESVDGTVFGETVAAIITETDGTLLIVSLDAFSYSPELDTYGEPIVRVPKTISEIGGDAYTEQCFLEKYLKGKSLSEILAIELDSDGRAVDQDLRRGCSLPLSNYIAAIEKAYINEYKTEMNGKNFALSLAVYIEPTADRATKSFTLTGSFAAIAASYGKIDGALIDANEVKLSAEYGESGVLASLTKSSKGTKLEQGDNYNMAVYNPYAKAEWYVQIMDYVENLKSIKLKGQSTVFPEHSTMCTIDTDSSRAALAKAAEKLK